MFHCKNDLTLGMLISNPNLCECIAKIGHALSLYVITTILYLWVGGMVIKLGHFANDNDKILLTVVI